MSARKETRLNLLSDSTILDLTRVLAGPYATMLLADLGARVIKVEPLAGDETRRAGDCFFGGTSAPFLMVNRGKESLCLNFRTEEGRAILLRLAARCDVFLHNFRPDVVEQAKLDYETLRRVRQDLIYCSISGYGESGPSRLKPAVDTIVQAIAGVMYSSGEEGDPPVRVGLPIVDLTAGLSAALGVLAAILDRQRTGCGQKLEIRLTDSILNMMLLKVGEHFISGREPVREANLPALVPSRHFRGSDGRYFSVSVVNERFFKRFVEVIGRPDWLADPRYATNPARVANRRMLLAELEGIFARRPAAEWLHDLEAADIPCGPVHTITEALADPVIGESLFRHPGLEALPLVRAPLRLETGMPAPEATLPPPAAGAHSTAILSEIGLSAREIEELAQRKVIQTIAAG